MLFFLTFPHSRILAFVPSFKESRIKPAHIKQNSHIKPFLYIWRKRLSRFKRKFEMPSSLSDILKGSTLRGWILVSTVLTGMCVFPLSEPKWLLLKTCTLYHTAETPLRYSRVSTWRNGKLEDKLPILPSCRALKGTSDNVSSGTGAY